MINRVTLVGNLGADPDVRATPNGGKIVALSLATSEHWRDSKSGEWRERTEWHRVKVFGKQADIAEQTLVKGSMVYVEGSLHQNTYTDKNGIERQSWEVQAGMIKLIGGNRREQNNGYKRNPNAQYQGQPQQQYQGQQYGNRGQAPQQQYQRQGGYQGQPQQYQNQQYGQQFSQPSQFQQGQNFGGQQARQPQQKPQPQPINAQQAGIGKEEIPF
ncbi:single-stranded DNA-binding protein [Moraxella sp. ZJ142]|uniref:single-stranded DNA-binding protein n=1 Tax=Moraxella marmotae TaxID=3344520 RepID=UPI0035D45096